MEITRGFFYSLAHALNKLIIITNVEKLSGLCKIGISDVQCYKPKIGTTIQHKAWYNPFNFLTLVCLKKFQVMEANI